MEETMQIPLSTRINIGDVITQSMIEETEKIVYNRTMNYKTRSKILKRQHRKLMLKMYRLFRKEPRLEKTCRNGNNQLILSCFTKYTFSTSSDVEYENFVDFKCVIQLCGYNLTYLNVAKFPVSGVMPLINANCHGLEELVVAFEEIKDEDFENVFSNMHKLKQLWIDWKCKNSTLPMTLVKSLEEVSGTLQTLSCFNESKDVVLLPDSLASVFPRFIALERLGLYGFPLSQTLIQSMSEITNLISLELISRDVCPIVDEKIDMYPIGNLKNLERVRITWNSAITDEFIINLCNNSKKLQVLNIVSTNITDNAMMAVNSLSQLEMLSLGLDKLNKTNNFITDKSTECLCHEKLWFLNLSNCTEISNRSVIKIFENLPNLSFLTIKNTNVTIEVVEELSKLTKFHKKKLHVYVSFKDCNGIFKSLMESHNVEFHTQ